jgi:hypothetical protein
MRIYYVSLQVSFHLGHISCLTIHAQQSRIFTLSKNLGKDKSNVHQTMNNGNTGCNAETCIAQQNSNCSTPSSHQLYLNHHQGN